MGTQQVDSRLDPPVHGLMQAQVVGTTTRLDHAKSTGVHYELTEGGWAATHRLASCDDALGLFDQAPPPRRCPR